MTRKRTLHHTPHHTMQYIDLTRYEASVLLNGFDADETLFFVVGSEGNHVPQDADEIQERLGTGGGAVRVKVAPCPSDEAVHIVRLRAQS